jgi:hypothetical protein
MHISVCAQHDVLSMIEGIDIPDGHAQGRCIGASEETPLQNFSSCSGGYKRTSQTSAELLFSDHS